MASGAQLIRTTQSDHLPISLFFLAATKKVLLDSSLTLLDFSLGNSCDFPKIAVKIIITIDLGPAMASHPAVDFYEAVILEMVKRESGYVPNARGSGNTRPTGWHTSIHYQSKEQNYKNYCNRN